jgi:SAM-dependent methyltransferase
VAEVGSADAPVIDYEGSQYKTDFWVGRGREYEDAAERFALRSLLPAAGRRIAEIGAGFGRLADLYLGYEQIILFDYSRTLLQDAALRWKGDPRFVFVAGNIYQLPLAAGVLDAVVCVRVMHHLADVPLALRRIRGALHAQSVAVIEYASKRNLKALARWLVGKQSWSPLTLQPVEFVELNFDFHPDWMRERFAEADLRITRQKAVSHFRLPLLKRIAPPGALARLDACLFDIGGRYPLSPSVFVQAKAAQVSSQAQVDAQPANMARLFACPQCRCEPMALVDENVVECPACCTRYARVQDIWDFKDKL